MPDYFDTATLAASFDRRTAPGQDFLNTVAPNRFQSDGEEVVIDEVLDDERIAQYVSPDVETPEGEKITREARSYEPTYTKERDTIKPSQGLKRRAGEPLMGDPGAAMDRFEQAVEDQLDTHQNRITRLEIKQANEVIQTGRVTVTGKSAANRVINYNRDADLSGAGVNWSGGSILENLEARSDKLGEIGGAMGRVLIVGSTAKNILVNDEEIKDNLDNRRAAGGELELNVLSSDKRNTMRYVGSLGDIDVWKYVQSYKANGTRQLFFPTNGSCIMDPEEFFGILAYGSVLDKKAGLVPLSRFAKVWDSEDPAATLAMTQSSPLMIPGNINAADFFTVT
ncbi:MAG: major capsid protein [Pseudomonadota bacterium]